MSFEHPSLVDDRLDSSRGALLERWEAMGPEEQVGAIAVVSAIKRLEFSDPRITFHRIQVNLIMVSGSLSDYGGPFKPTLSLYVACSVRYSLVLVPGHAT